MGHPQCEKAFKLFCELFRDALLQCRGNDAQICVCKCCLAGAASGFVAPGFVSTYRPAGFNDGA